MVENADMMTHVDANLYWNKDEFSARFLTGNVGDVLVQRGRVVIAPVLASGERCTCLVNRKRRCRKRARSRASVGLSKYGSFDFNKIEADGEIGSLCASLPMVKKGGLLSALRHLKLL